MLNFDLKVYENYVSLNGTLIPKKVWNLLMKNERLLAINEYRKSKKVSLDVAVNFVNPIYASITEDVQ